ncbi:MAG: AI-2E family transporter [Saprospiraceae bacterium]|nr:AI-2E family transporter [Saprospiraceae bacterium]
MQNQISAHIIRQIIFLIILGVLTVFMIRELSFLLVPCLGAITFYVILRNLMIRLVELRKWKKWLAALILILATLIIIVSPLAWLVNFGYNKILIVMENPDMIKKSFLNISSYINNQFGINIIDQEYVSKINNFLMEIAQAFLGTTINSIGSFGMMYLLLYFMLYQFKDIEIWMSTRLPFKKVNSQKLVRKTQDLIVSNALGIPVVAIIQGLIGMLGYWIFGVDDFVLFGVLTGIGSVIPVVGSAIAYLPLSVYMLSQGLTWQGIGVGLWGMFIIGTSDNVARFALQKYMSDTHPLVTIFGVIMGINVFGFMGVIFGPILLSLFVLLVDIYTDEYEAME